MQQSSSSNKKMAIRPRSAFELYTTRGGWETIKMMKASKALGPDGLYTVNLKAIVLLAIYFFFYKSFQSLSIVPHLSSNIKEFKGGTTSKT